MGSVVDLAKLYLTQLHAAKTVFVLLLLLQRRCNGPNPSCDGSCFHFFLLQGWRKAHGVLIRGKLDLFDANQSVSHGTVYNVCTDTLLYLYLYCIPPHTKHFCFKTTSLHRPVYQPPHSVLYHTRKTPLLQDHLSTETSPSTSQWCTSPHSKHLCLKTTSLHRPVCQPPHSVLYHTRKTPLLQDHLSTETSPSTSP